jgi:hypothetical protein
METRSWLHIYPFKTILTSHPLNTHLTRNSNTAEARERLTIEIFGMPPHLCCNTVIYRLFSEVCIIRQIKLISATLQYEITAHGHLSAVSDDVAHIGLRGIGQLRETVKIWPLSYRTFT